MKLDVTNFRYITKDEFRVLTAVEMGMRNHELVPATLVESIAKISRGGCYKLLQALLRNKLVAHDGKKYDGYRLTYHGFDYLAIRALAMRGSIVAVGRRLGVGKESDVHFAQGPNGEVYALKLHRLGRISFRAIKQKRDYLRGREHASWMYMARLAAMKEFAYMKALADEGFPVPTPVDQNRHVVVMTFVRATPLYHLRGISLRRPDQVLERLMRLLVRLARAGVVHGDFNEFNLMIDAEEKITLIDFPQIVHLTHANAEEFFDRDVLGVREFFRKRMNIEVEEWPTWREVMEGAAEAEALGEGRGGILRSGAVEGLGRDDDNLLVAAHERRRAPEAEGGEQEDEGRGDDDSDGQEEEEEEGSDAGTDGGTQLGKDDGPPAFEPLLGEGVRAAPGVEEEALEEAMSSVNCEAGRDRATAAAARADTGEAAVAAATEAAGEEAGRDRATAASARADTGEAAVAAAGEAAGAQAAEGEEVEGEDSDDSEESAGPGQVAVAGRRVRRKHTAKDAKKSLQREKKQRPAKPNNQKAKETRRAQSEIKEYFQ